jgi:hypothetical protein
MLLRIKDDYIVDCKQTRKILNKKGFSFRTFKHNKQLFSVNLMPKARNMYPDEMTALQQIEIVVRRKNTNENKQIQVIQKCF